MKAKVRIRERSDAGVRPLLAAARRFERLSAEQERALATRASGGDAGARDELVRRHLPLVVAFARRQARGTLPFDEIVQEGNLGLLRAIEKYDPGAGTRFSTYALWWIRAYMWRYLRSARSAVRPKSGTTARADLSLEAPLGEDGSATWLEQLEDEGPTPDARYSGAEGDARLRGALDRVRPRIGELGWDVIHTRLQQDPPDTLEQIGRRWGVSRERVRQIEVRTRRYLQGYLKPMLDEAA